MDTLINSYFLKKNSFFSKKWRNYNLESKHSVKGFVPKNVCLHDVYIILVIIATFLTCPAA